MNIQVSVSRGFLLLSFFIPLLFSCKQSAPASLEEVLEKLSPSAQQNSIDPSKDNLIEGKKGTKIFIPANSFQFKDGSYPKEKVSIELKEFYSIADMVSNQLSTNSNGFLLETAGMIHLAAFAEGKELQLNKEKSLVVAFPNKDASKEMGMFYGDTLPEGQVNWQSALGRNETRGIDDYADSTFYENKISACSYQSGINGDTVLWQISHPDSSFFVYMAKNFKSSDTALANELCVRGEFCHMYLNFDKSGKVSEIDFDTKLDRAKDDHHITPAPVKKAITDFFRSFPPIRLETMAKGTQIGFYLSLCCHRAFNEDKFREQFNKKYSQYRDKAIKQIDPNELNFYILSTSKLGWINCDRFLDENRELTDFIVKTDVAADANVMIVFDDLNSIMQGQKSNGSFVFRNIPLNSKIRVVGITYKDGMPLLSKVPATISKQDFVLSGFKEFPLNELENELNKK